jgi:hypothetical protein
MSSHKIALVVSSLRNAHALGPAVVADLESNEQGGLSCVTLLVESTHGLRE